MVLEQNERNVQEGHGEKGLGKLFKGWDIAIWFTPIPIIGYAITFSYELGVSHYYQYPTSFISLEHTTVAKNSFILVLLLLLVFLFQELYILFSNYLNKSYYQKHPKTEQEIQAYNEFFRIGALMILLLATSHLTIGRLLRFYIGKYSHYGPIYDSYPTYIKMSFAIILILSVFLVILIFKWGWDSFFEKKNYKLGFSIATIFLLTIPYILGLSSAVGKSSYYVIAGEKETYVVLSFVKDNLLIAPLDLENGTIAPKYSFIQTKTDFEPMNEKNKKQISTNLAETGRLMIGDKETIR